MTGKRPLDYHRSGVLDNTQLGLSALVNRLSRTVAFRATGPGRRGVDIRFFARVVPITHTLRPALCNRGGGKKVPGAEMLHRYDTSGLDVVANEQDDRMR